MQSPESNALEFRDESGEMSIIRIDPGDRVLIALKDHIDGEEAINMKDALKDRFPDAEFTVITGVVGIGYESA